MIKQITDLDTVDNLNDNCLFILDDASKKTKKVDFATLENKINSDIPIASSNANGLMSSTNFSKLDGISSGAEVNLNAFSNVKVGSTTIDANSKTDTIELVAGSNVTLTPDAANKKVTIETGGGIMFSGGPVIDSESFKTKTMDVSLLKGNLGKIYTATENCSFSFYGEIDSSQFAGSTSIYYYINNNKVARMKDDGSALVFFCFNGFMKTGDVFLIGLTGSTVPGATLTYWYSANSFRL